MRRLFGYVVIALGLAMAAGCSSSQQQAAPGRIVRSADGVPISYSVNGTGDVTLVFIHGWSCDARYWCGQTPYFARRYRVVTVDLAGHGHSGFGRKDYTMAAFGEDIKAVVMQLDARRVILIGHSMGEAVIVEAAELMPDRVIGIIGVDTFQDVEAKCTQEQMEELVPDEDKYYADTAKFVGTMLGSGLDAELGSWIVADMASSPPQVGLSAMREYLGLYVRSDFARMVEGVKCPVRAVNADMWPTAIDTNRRHMASFEVAIMKGAGHFVMLERPDEFNVHLDRAIVDLTR